MKMLPDGSKFSCETSMECHEIVEIKASVQEQTLTVLFAIPFTTLDSALDLYAVNYNSMLDIETGKS
jgi:hypothetical protein